jgi:glutaredoxin 3
MWAFNLLLFSLALMFGFGTKSPTPTSLEELITQNRCVMFSMPSCPWCVKAEELLKGKKLKCKTINLTESQYLAFEVIKATGQRTVPNLFIDGEHVGGYENLKELSSKCTKKPSEDSRCAFFAGKKRV